MCLCFDWSNNCGNFINIPAQKMHKKIYYSLKIVIPLYKKTHYTLMQDVTENWRKYLMKMKRLRIKTRDTMITKQVLSNHSFLILPVSSTKISGLHKNCTIFPDVRP